MKVSTPRTARPAWFRWSADRRCRRLAQTTHRPARRPENTQSAIDSPLTYESEQIPIAVRPALNRPGIGAPEAARTAPVASSTRIPPRVSMGVGLIRFGWMEMFSSVNGSRSILRTNCSGFPAGSRCGCRLRRCES